MPKSPFQDIVGKVLLPEDLSDKQLSLPLIDHVAQDPAAHGIDVKRTIEDAIEIGQDIAKQLDKIKPMTRALIVKTLFEHSREKDKKAFAILAKLGI